MRRVAYKGFDAGSAQALRLSGRRSVYLFNSDGGTRAEPFQDVIAHAERVCHDGQRRIHSSAGGEEAAVNDVQVIELVRLAVRIERRSLRIAAEPDRAVLMRYTREGDSIADEQVSRDQVGVHVKVLKQV